MQTGRMQAAAAEQNASSSNQQQQQKAGSSSSRRQAAAAAEGRQQQQQQQQKASSSSISSSSSRRQAAAAGAAAAAAAAEIRSSGRPFCRVRPLPQIAGGYTHLSLFLGHILPPGAPDTAPDFSSETLGVCCFLPQIDLDDSLNPVRICISSATGAPRSYRAVVLLSNFACVSARAYLKGPKQFKQCVIPENEGRKAALSAST